MGGAQAIAALALRHRVRPARRRDRRPGPLYAQEAKRQVFGHVGIDGFAGPSDLVVVASAGRPWRSWPWTRSRRPSTARAPRRGRPARPGVARALERDLGDVRRPAAGRTWRTSRRRSRSPRRFAPEHLQLIGAGRRGARAARHAGRLRVRRRRERRPRSATTWRARTTCRRPTARRASPPALSVRHFGRTDVPTWRSAPRPPRALALARCCRSRRGRGSARMPASMPANGRPRDDPHRRPRPPPSARPTSRLRLALDGCGARHARHRRRLPRPHARPARASCPPGPRRRRSPATSATGAHDTVEDTGIVLGQALDRALGDRTRHPPRRPRRGPHGRGARRRRDRPLARPSPASSAGPGAAAGPDRRLRPRPRRGVLPRRRQRGAADAARGPLAGRHERPPHGRGLLQGGRARAARGRAAIDLEESGVPSTTGCSSA